MYLLEQVIWTNNRQGPGPRISEASRMLLHAAVSFDDGETFVGHREIMRDPLVKVSISPTGSITDDYGALQLLREILSIYLFYLSVEPELHVHVCTVAPELVFIAIIACRRRLPLWCRASRRFNCDRGRTRKRPLGVLSDRSRLAAGDQPDCRLHQHHRRQSVE